MYFITLHNMLTDRPRTISLWIDCLLHNNRIIFMMTVVIMFYILLIAVSCHFPVCVRLSHSIKRLLTYLLTFSVAENLSVLNAYLGLSSADAILISVLSVLPYYVLQLH